MAHAKVGKGRSPKKKVSEEELDKKVKEMKEQMEKDKAKRKTSLTFEEKRRLERRKKALESRKK